MGQTLRQGNMFRQAMPEFTSKCMAAANPLYCFMVARVYDERPAGICESKAEKLEPSSSRWSFVIHSCYALSVIQFLQTLFYSVMNDQRVTPEPLMHNHNAGSAKHGGIVRRSRIVHQLVNTRNNT